ncbi:MAG: hypothetical protein KBD25_06275, partial [Rickettsiaceae bacterium]|nr:hypothetical protein [Rickettsiaceae bacterium]
AKIVVHSNTLPSTLVIWKTLRNGAANGLLIPYIKLVNPASAFASSSLRMNRNAKITSSNPKAYQTICVPRYSGFVLEEL